MFSKHFGSRVAYERKVPKDYSYLPVLIDNIVQKISFTFLRKKAPYQVDDLRLLSKNIAPIPAPSTESIVQSKKSRLH